MQWELQNHFFRIGGSNVVHDNFDYALAFLGILVPVVLTLSLRRSDRAAKSEKRIDKIFRILAVLTNDPDIEGTYPD